MQNKIIVVDPQTKIAQPAQPVIMVDAETGEQVVVIQQAMPNQRVAASVKPVLHVDANRILAQRDRLGPYPGELPRRERKARFVGKWFALFVLSWVPCALGAPGGTLLAWGMLAAYTLYKAVR